MIDVEAENRVRKQLLETRRSQLPRTYRLLMGSRYQLPSSRQADYPCAHHAASHDVTGFLEHYQKSKSTLSPAVGATTDATANIRAAWLSLGMAALFLERELAEALLRTELPEGFVPADIHWKRDAFRLFLPNGLFRMEHADGTLEPTCVTLVHFTQGKPIAVDQRVLDDLSDLSKRDPDVNPSARLMETPDQDSLWMVLQMRTGPNEMGALSLLSICALEDRPLTSLAADKDKFFAENNWTQSQSSCLRHVLKLVFNVLLFMGALPLEYDRETILRPYKEKKGKVKAELRQARFVGQELYRPDRRTASEKGHEHTGRTLPGHWRAGAWRRQPYGPQHSLRRLQWVKPYRTQGPNDEETA